MKSGTVEYTSRELIVQVKVVCTDTKQGISGAVLEADGGIHFTGVTTEQHQLDAGFGVDVH